MKIDRAAILDEAKAYVTQDRASTYGSLEDNFATIADLWFSYLDSVNCSERGLAPTDVAAMMILLKVARIAKNPHHHDSWVDIAGYAACGGELAAKVQETFDKMGE